MKNLKIFMFLTLLLTFIRSAHVRFTFVLKNQLCTSLSYIDLIVFAEKGTKKQLSQHESLRAFVSVGKKIVDVPLKIRFHEDSLIFELRRLFESRGGLDQHNLIKTCSDIFLSLLLIFNNGDEAEEEHLRLMCWNREQMESCGLLRRQLRRTRRPQPISFETNCPFVFAGFESKNLFLTVNSLSPTYVSITTGPDKQPILRKKKFSIQPGTPRRQRIVLYVSASYPHDFLEVVANVIGIGRGSASIRLSVLRLDKNLGNSEALLSPKKCIPRLKLRSKKAFFFPGQRTLPLFVRWTMPLVDPIVLDTSKMSYTSESRVRIVPQTVSIYPRQKSFFITFLTSTDLYFRLFFPTLLEKIQVDMHYFPPSISDDCGKKFFIFTRCPTVPLLLIFSSYKAFLSKSINFSNCLFQSKSKKRAELARGRSINFYAIPHSLFTLKKLLLDDETLEKRLYTLFHPLKSFPDSEETQPRIWKQMKVQQKIFLQASTPFELCLVFFPNQMSAFSGHLHVVISYVQRLCMDNSEREHSRRFQNDLKVTYRRYFSRPWGEDFGCRVNISNFLQPQERRWAAVALTDLGGQLRLLQLKLLLPKKSRPASRKVLIANSDLLIEFVRREKENSNLRKVFPTPIAEGGVLADFQQTQLPASKKNICEKPSKNIKLLHLVGKKQPTEKLLRRAQEFFAYEEKAFKVLEFQDIDLSSELRGVFPRGLHLDLKVHFKDANSAHIWDHLLLADIYRNNWVFVQRIEVEMQRGFQGSTVTCTRFSSKTAGRKWMYRPFRQYSLRPKWTAAKNFLELPLRIEELQVHNFYRVKLSWCARTGDEVAFCSRSITKNALTHKPLGLKLKNQNQLQNVVSLIIFLFLI